MEFIKDDHINTRQVGIGLEHRCQNALGDNLDPGRFGYLRIAAHPVADGLAQRLTKRFRHPGGGSPCREATRFKHQDFTRNIRQQSQRHTRGFPSTRWRLKHSAPSAAQRGAQIRQNGVDRKVGHRRRSTASPYTVGTRTSVTRSLSAIGCSLRVIGKTERSAKSSGEKPPNRV